MNVQPMIGLLEGLVNIFDGKMRHVSLFLRDQEQLHFFDYRDRGFNTAPDPGAGFGSVVMWEISPVMAAAGVALLNLLHARQAHFTFKKPATEPYKLVTAFDEACRDTPPDSPLEITCTSIAGLILQKLGTEPPVLSGDELRIAQPFTAGELHRTRQVRDMAIALCPKADSWTVRNRPDLTQTFTLRTGPWMTYPDLQARIEQVAALPQHRAA